MDEADATEQEIPRDTTQKSNDDENKKPLKKGLIDVKTKHIEIHQEDKQDDTE